MLELLLAVSTVVGFAVLLVTVTIIVVLPLDYSNCNNYWYITYFGFGVIYLNSEDYINQFNRLCKTEGKRLFINAPKWFNKYVYNFGVKHANS